MNTSSKMPYRAPSCSRETALCEAFEAVLGCGKVGLDDPFFALGGKEADVLHLKEYLERSKGLTLSEEEITAAGTPARMAPALRPVAGVIPHSAAVPAAVPLTDMQRGIWFECAQDPSSTRYNIAFMLRLPGSTDPDRFAHAVEAAASRHPVLFSAVRVSEDGTPELVPGAYPFTLTRESAPSDEAAAGRFVRPFDPEHAPLYRFSLCATPDGPVFLLDVHHLIFDGTSLRLLLGQILAAYDDQGIPEERATQFDLPAYEDSLRQSPAYLEALSFFRDQFEGTDFDTAPVPDAVPSGHSEEPGVPFLDIPVPAELSPESVHARAGASGITQSTLFTAAFAIALASFRGSQEACFTLADTGRHTADLSDSVGMFVRSLPIHLTFSRDDSCDSCLHEVSRILGLTVANGCVPFSELARLYGADLSVSFVFQGALLSELPFGRESVFPEKLPLNSCQSDILFMVLRLKDSYRFHIEYRKERYSGELIRSLAETVFTVAEGLLSREKLGDIPLLPEGQRAILNAFNQTDFPYSPAETVQEMLRKRISEAPDRTALVCGERSYTYAEFDRITGALAAFIRSSGLGAEDFTAVLTPRNDAGVLAAWGAIRAGTAVQMLDPAYPPERLEYMLSDSGARLLITDRSLRQAVPGYQGAVLYTEDLPDLPVTAVPDGIGRPEDALAVIYTSGTTGRPKGVVLENRNLAAFCRNHARTLEIGPDARVASYASFGFDAGLMDIVSTLTSGAALYIIPDELRLDFGRMDAFFCENGITHGFMTTQVGRMFALETRCETLRVLLVGGEKLVPLEPKDSFRFVNGYGPCETMAYICSHDVTDSSPIQPIGRPAPNTRLYVTDRCGRLLPPGAVGELWIAGLQVGRGYLGLPEKTAEVFISNPFTDDPDFARVYRTGDDVRLLPRGELEYIGRSDGQVKIRGFRVELTEVEEVIRRFPGVEDATVAAFDEPGGGKYLAAYIAGSDPVDTEKLRAFIRSEKPDYMVPAAITQLERIPYTVNRKVDKRALPVPERKTEAPVPPADDTENRIFSIAAEVLGHEGFGVMTDLFEAGLTSIGTLKLNLALGKAFGVPVKLSDLREHPTVRSLAGFLAQSAAPAASDTQDRPECYPLLRNQLGVLLDAGADSSSLRYNIPLLLKLSPEIDPEKLCEAVRKAIDAHPYMKATFVADEDGNVRAVRNDSDPPEVTLLRTDISPVPEDLVRPFQLMGGRLYRANVCVTPSEPSLFLDVHHLIADGTSVAVLLRDITAAYEGSALPTESYTAFDAAAEESAQTAGCEAALQYYEKLLAGANTDCLPAPCPDPDSGKACGTLTRSFGGASASVLAFCDRNGISVNAFMNGVFAWTLSGFLHADDVTWCTVFSGRSDPRLAESFAMLVRTLPVRCAVDSDASVLSFLQSVQKQLLDTMACDTVPFSELHSRFGVTPDIFMNYQGDAFNFDCLCGKKAEMLPFAFSDAKAPLSAEIFLDQGIFRAEFAWRTDLYNSDLVSSFSSALVAAAEGFTRAERLREVSLLSGEEQTYFTRMNSTAAPFEAIPAQVLFERAAAEHPDRVAARDRVSQISFGELNARADRLAGALVSLGAMPDELIGLILERDISVPVAEIGVLKAGCAFLPMLPTYPDDRLSFCLTDASCRFVIAPRAVISARPSLFAEDRPYRALALEDLTEGRTVKAVSPDNGRKALPQHLAYCIYTSGSTGTPKGVMIEQHSLSNFVQTSALCDTLARGSTVLCMASVSFDMSVTEIFFSLCRGKTVYIAAEEEIHDLDLLLHAFEVSPIDVIMMTPSFAWNLLASPAFEPALSSLKAVVLGAEAFQPALFDRLRALNPTLLIQNGYGPTECTQVCSLKTLSSGEHITVGGPFANTAFHVADRSGNLLPRYALGELLISGEGVCRGYVNQPDKNAAAFLLLDGKRTYRSGDLVRVNRDLEVEFGGRADRQVKLRGFRIELDEVESVMQAFPGVTRAAVIVRSNGREDFLAGYYTADLSVPPEELAAFMRTKLTYYMVPAAMMQLERMPVTPGGKLDRKSLPEIRPEKRERARRAPKKSLEQKITDLFASVLNTDECWPDDNFFEIGGTSLSASRVVMQLKADGYRIEYQDIFDHQSPAELAEYLESRISAESGPVSGEDATAADGDGIPDGVLKYNTMEYAPKVERQPLGDVLLTGATGFLGAHILRTLLDTEDGQVICLLRRGKYDDVMTRLKATMVYYFEDDCADLFRDRVTVLEGDVTDENLPGLFGDRRIDTVINCAASVKHFANDSSIEKVNVGGVENLIRLASDRGAKLIQISTTSVPGMHTDETWRVNLQMPENRLFVIDDMNNQYIRSKYQAELRVLRAVHGGLRAKIIRVGNLMGRYTDGEFQTNMRTNAFLNGLRGFVNIGKCPISHATDPMTFSPVDSTARAVVLLAGTNDMFTVFNADTRFVFDEMKVIDTVNRCGIPVRPVPDEEYYADYYRIMADPEHNAGVAALLTNDRPDLHPVRTENRFTANILYRLGFSWPFTDDTYLEKVIQSLDTMAFFSED